MLPNIALMVDADNISSKAIRSILEKAHGKGNVLLYFASGKEGALKGWRAVIVEHRFRTITAYVGKDVADRVIVKECADISLERPDIDTFCIVSNDAGFAPICHLLRTWGKKVFVIGNEHASKSLKDAFEFFCLEVSTGIDPKTNKLMKLLEETFALFNVEWVHLSLLKETLQKVDPTFQAKEYGNAKLSKLLQTLPEFVELKQGKHVHLARLKKTSTKN